MHLDARAADPRLASDLESLGAGYENMHVVDGHPGPEALRRWSRSSRTSAICARWSRGAAARSTRGLLHHADGYGVGNGYDFIGYFEFAEADAPIFRDVMTGLRDRAENPEWVYGREGPEWWSRRVGHARELW